MELMIEDLIALLNQVPEFLHGEGRRDDLLKGTSKNQVFAVALLT